MKSHAIATPMVAFVITVAAACGPVTAPAGNPAPVNACPAHPCEAYKQDGTAPSCTGGVCTVAGPVANLVLVVGLADDTYTAPDRTYLISFGDQPPTGACALANCKLAMPCTIAPWAVDQGLYQFSLNASSQANWYFGNGKQVTALPVNVVYRPLLGFPSQDAIDLGLPLQPIQAINLQNPATTPPGPDGTQALAFEAYMQSGCYERTLQPFAPFSSAFPPEIKPWTPGGTEEAPVDTFDVTTETNGTRTLPQFDIARAEGLDGWSAYLRNIQTKRVFSNVVPLSGSLAQNVTLLTNHLLVPGEALTDLELVVAPPAGLPLPTEVIAAQGPPGAQVLPASELYPSLPTPVTVSGSIRTAAEVPVPADVTFTAIDITNRAGQAFPKNFEFTATVSAIRDPHTGVTTYSALLPQGDYQVAVRPTDSASAVTLVPLGVGGQGSAMTGEDIDVGPLVPVTGIATVADGRPLAQAIVEAMPTDCPSAADDASVVSAPPSSACLPRSAQTITGTDGSFALALDPGVYTLRARPVEGSRLPWVNRTITVGAIRLTVPITVPAPMSVGVTLQDVASHPIANAVVRLFTMPAVGVPPIEVGQAITGVDGSYEMFLAPLSQ
jgi:hypothetical protein